MSRYRQKLDIEAPRRRELADVGTVGDVGGLRLRVHESEVRAYIPIASSYTSPPKFTGEITAQESGLRLVGQIKESLASSMWTRSDLFVLVLLAACGVLGLINLIGGHLGALWPLSIGILGSPAFALLFRVHRDQRRAEWRTQSADLAQQLTSYLRNSDVTSS